MLGIETFESNYANLAVGYLVAGLAAMVLALVPGFGKFYMLIHHGRGLKGKILPQYEWLFLSKNYFASFYIVGLASGLYVNWTYGMNSVKAAFLLHMVRRLFETVILFKSSTKMNLLHLLIGICFYPSVWVLLANTNTDLTIYGLLPLLGFFRSFFLQWQCHLAMSRNKDKKRLPDFVLFQYYICPNMTMECGMYFFLHLMVLKDWSMLLLLFVLFNQTITAVDRKGIYKNEPTHAIFPFRKL